MRLALAQCESAIGTEHRDPRPRNVKRALEAIDQAARAGSKLVTFGEMFLTGLRTDRWLPKWAIDPNNPSDPSVAELSSCCARHNIDVAVGGATISCDGSIRNSVLYFTSEGLLIVRDKAHLAQITLADGYDANETRYYSAGNEEQPPFERPWGTVAIQVCYEVTFPEIARVAMLQGADLIINCTASLAGTEGIWNAMARTRAFENAVWFVVSSVAGVQGPDQYFGGSAVVDPTGVIVAQAAYGAEDLVIADVTPTDARTVRKQMNVVDARLPHRYAPVVQPKGAP